MIPIVRKIFVVTLALIISMSIILIDCAFPNLGLFYVHGGPAPGLLLIYLFPIATIFLFFAVPIAILKLTKISDPTTAHQWMITVSAPILLIINLALFFVNFVSS